MRRFISLGLVIALLLVSGMPLVSATETCGMDSMQKRANHVMTDTDAHSGPHGKVHDESHGPVLDLPADTCRIECGCGCHSSMDSLPNLLAPHAPCIQSSAVVSPEQVVILLPVFDLTPLAPVIIPPPPRNI